MRFAVAMILIFALMHPMLTQPYLDDVENPYFTDAGYVDVIQEIEPNDLSPREAWRLIYELTDLAKKHS